jgi:hypothetical protein
LVLWRLDSDLHIKWQATAPWSLPTIDLVLPFESAHQAIATFFDNFLAQLARRVAEIECDGWHREDCELDVPGLVREQQERMQEAESALSTPRRTDWDLVRQRLDQVGA